MSSRTTSSSAFATAAKSTSTSSRRLHSCLGRANNSNNENNENDAVIENEDNNNHSSSDITFTNNGHCYENNSGRRRHSPRPRAVPSGGLTASTTSNDDVTKTRRRGNENDQGGSSSKKPRHGTSGTSSTVQPPPSVSSSLSQYFPKIPCPNKNELSDAKRRANELLAKSSTIEESVEFPKFSSKALCAKLEEVAIEYSDRKNAKGRRKSAYNETLHFHLDDGKGDSLVLKTNKCGDEMARLLNKIQGLFKKKKSKLPLYWELRTYFDKDECFYGKLFHGMKIVLTQHIIWGRQIGEYNNGIQRIEEHLRQRKLEEDQSSHFSELPRCIIPHRDVERLRLFGTTNTLNLLSNMDSNTFKCINMLRHYARNLGEDSERTGMMDLPGAIVAKNTSKTSASAESVILTLSNALATMHEEYLPLRDIVVATTKEKLNELVQYHFPNISQQDIVSVRTKVYLGSSTESINIYPERLSQQVTDVIHCLRLVIQFVFTARNSLELMELVVTIGK